MSINQLLRVVKPVADIRKEDHCNSYILLFCPTGTNLSQLAQYSWLKDKIIVNTFHGVLGYT